MRVFCCADLSYLYTTLSLSTIHSFQVYLTPSIHTSQSQHSMGIPQSSIIREQTSYNRHHRNARRRRKRVPNTIIVYQTRLHLDIRRQAAKRSDRMPDAVDDLILFWNSSEGLWEPPVQCVLDDRCADGYTPDSAQGSDQVNS